jgi:hypothetical protein
MKMDAIPAYYEAAKANIKNPTLEHTALGISQNLGGLSFFDLTTALNKSKLNPDEKEQIKIKQNSSACYCRLH